MKIAVVGAGLSGASIVKSLLTHPNLKDNDQIDVFEPRESLGVGLPYVPFDDESLRLNVSPDGLSVDQNNPDDFTEWLEHNYEEPTNFEGLVSRPAYGKYLVDRFAPYFNHKQVQHIQTMVTDMKVLDEKTGEEAVGDRDTTYIYRLKTEHGWSETIYDAIFFAVGHSPYNDYYDLKGAENYIHHPYPMAEKLADIDSSKKIGVIGSGATGIDLMRYFVLKHDLKHPLSFYDPNPPFNFVNIPYEKELPFTFSMDWIEAKKSTYEGGFIPFEVILETFKTDIAQDHVDPKAVYEKYKAGTLELKREALESNDQELALLHAYASQLVHLLPHLYNALSGEDKDYYLENYHQPLLFFKAKVPNLTYKWLFDLMDAGKVRAISGLKDVEVKADNGFLVTADEIDEVDVLVNATGFDMNLQSVAKESELIKNLYNKEIILSHHEGKYILVDWPQCRVISQRYGVLENVYFFGLLIGGTQHENNDAALTIEQGTISAKFFMDTRDE